MSCTLDVWEELGYIFVLQDRDWLQQNIQTSPFAVKIGTPDKESNVPIWTWRSYVVLASQSTSKRSSWWQSQGLAFPPIQMSCAQRPAMGHRFIYIYINCWIYLWIAMARKRLYMYIGGFLDVLVESCEHLHDVTRFCMFWHTGGVAVLHQEVLSDLNPGDRLGLRGPALDAWDGWKGVRSDRWFVAEVESRYGHLD